MNAILLLNDKNPVKRLNKFSFGNCSLTPHGSLPYAIHLLHQAVVEELRWPGLLCIRDRLRQKVQNPLNPGFGYHQLSPEARAAIELVGFVEGIGIGFFGIFGYDFDRKTLVAVVAVDPYA